MVKVTFVRPDGTDTIVEADPGSTVMQTAVANGVGEIVAECGGTLACATCHVYVDDADIDLLGEIGADEEEMLGFTASPREPGSRLSCQLTLSPELDGLVVRVPPEQY
ncbi:MAG TPA: 2Fe-2S iron-sulfur cluster-binding protein [Amycolatopsis sp.]|nr:2Fe-2S iron-sulfur cluster-binding protein [Amycolatopsis sp.]